MKIKTERTSIAGKSILSVVAGTDCPQLDEFGHCSRTFLKIEDMGSTHWSVGINQNSPKNFDNPESVIIAFSGDSECENLLKALKFAVSTLESQIEENKQKLQNFVESDN